MSQFVIPAKPCEAGREPVEDPGLSGNPEAFEMIPFPGFPFDVAQGGEHLEPRISLRFAPFVRNDVLSEL